LKLLLDEHFSRLIAVQLRADGHDAICASERPELVGMSDADLFQAAHAEDRALVTENVGDFVLLARRATAAGIDHAGLVFTSYRTFSRSRAGIGPLVAALAALLNAHPDDRALWDRIVWLDPARPGFG
jgi:hypothetical protein